MFDPPEGSKLKEELDSWPYFEATLGLEDRVILRKMNESILQCVKVIEVVLEGYDTEA